MRSSPLTSRRLLGFDQALEVGETVEWSSTESLVASHFLCYVYLQMGLTLFVIAHKWPTMNSVKCSGTQIFTYRESAVNVELKKIGQLNDNEYWLHC